MKPDTAEIRRTKTERRGQQPLHAGSDRASQLSCGTSSKLSEGVATWTMLGLRYKYAVRLKTLRYLRLPALSFA